MFQTSADSEPSERITTITPITITITTTITPTRESVLAQPINLCLELFSTFYVFHQLLVRRCCPSLERLPAQLSRENVGKTNQTNKQIRTKAMLNCLWYDIKAFCVFMRRSVLFRFIEVLTAFLALCSQNFQDYLTGTNNVGPTWGITV